MNTAEAVWKIILDDLNERAGTAYRYQEFDTTERNVAEKVLPILAPWVERVREPGARGVLYSKFVTPYARPYFDLLLKWFQLEAELLNRAFLTRIVSKLAKPDDAEQLWEMWTRKERNPADYVLFARLASFPKTEQLAKDLLCEDLQRRQMTPGELQDIASVNDERIRAWFQGQVESPNKYIRNIARRAIAVKTRSRVPKRSATTPDRSKELFSTEVDIHNLESAVIQIAQRTGVSIPTSMINEQFWSSLEVDQWTSIPTPLASGLAVSIWLRLEDVDTVEIVIA